MVGTCLRISFLHRINTLERFKIVLLGFTRVEIHLHQEPIPAVEIAVETSIALNLVAFSICPISDVHEGQFTLKVQFVEEGLSPEILDHVLDEMAFALVPHGHCHSGAIFGPSQVAVLQINHRHWLFELSVLLPFLVDISEIFISIVWPSVVGICGLRLLGNSSRRLPEEGKSDRHAEQLHCGYCSWSYLRSSLCR